MQRLEVSGAVRPIYV